MKMSDYFPGNGQVVTGTNKARSYDGDYMAVGKKGEEVVMAWLASRPYVIGVDDLRQLRVMREADVDCSFSLSDGRVALAEIKTDQHLGKSGNILFEILRVNHTAPTDRAGVLGWSLRSPATWLLYYAPAVAMIYQLRFADFRAGFQRYTAVARERSRQIWVNTDQIKSTLNVLVPESYFPTLLKHPLS
jgi:hypothetical protein